MHTPVMVAEVLTNLAVKKGGWYVDATLGEAGHAASILEAVGSEGRLLGVDRDSEALTEAGKRLKAWENQVVFVKSNFSSLGTALVDNGFGAVDGVLFDLGVRSAQLDHSERGFSFQEDGPLDMRMDQEEGLTAADIVNTWPENELSSALWKLADERSSRRIAKAVVARRAHQSFTRTADLADVVSAATGGRRGRLHPATRTFMALRMLVNRELESIEAGLKAAINGLKSGGRLVVLTYHSIEDRLVKSLLKSHVGQWVSLQAGGRVWRGVDPQLAWVHRKPITPCKDELMANARSRSAKLRVVERMGL